MERRAFAAVFRAVSASLLLLLAPLISSCAGEFDTVGEALRLPQPDLEAAILNEPYDAALPAVGGLRPYTFRLTSGSLPPGLTLSGGSLRGTPTELGTFDFTIMVSDGNLSQVSRDYRLRVSELPPPEFTLNVPDTELRGPVTLRARVSGARALAGARMLLTWDADQFELKEGSVTLMGGEAALLVDEGEGQLQVHLAFLGRTVNGSKDLFTFQLEPLLTPTTLRVEQRVELRQFGSGREPLHHFIRRSEGRSSPPPTSTEEPGAPLESEAEDEGETEDQAEDQAEGEAEEGEPRDGGNTDE